MVSITLSVPSDMKKDMDSFPEMNWSAVAREAIKRKIVMMERFKKFTADSEFGEEDALKLGREVNKKVSDRLRNMKA